jgi:hypothetical protein
MNPYASAAYAATLGHIGRPLSLPHAGAQLLVRTAGGITDACAPYPLLACVNWDALPADLGALAHAADVVSVVAVTDPLAAVAPEVLTSAFPDLATPWKVHYLVDLTSGLAAQADRRHLKKAAKAAALLAVDLPPSPRPFLDEWCGLYGDLGARHGITGAADFPRASFEGLFTVPDLRLVLARHEGVAVAASLWFVADGVAQYHLGASSAAGYAIGASFALFAAALEAFAAEGVAVANLGGSAGLSDDPADGLARFKKGWGRERREAWLCGRVLDRDRYDRLTADRAPARPFFPAYRG